MSNYKRRILLVVDGSYQAYETVHYASQTLPPADTEVALLHISSKVPDSFWDLEKDPVWQQKVQTVRGWEIQQEKKINEFMERALALFKDARFPGAAVKIDVRERKEGIARDIAAESHRGYDAVVLGRRGLSTIPDLSLGGVACKIVLKVSDLAVWLVGGRPDSERVLVGMDTSEGSMLAVKHLARIADGLERKILLLHVVRKPTPELEGPNGSGFLEYQKERDKKAAAEIEPIFTRAVELLRSEGFNPQNVRTKIITGATTRAGTILEEARAGGYGTIAVGRRGLSTVEEFDMGRVSNKLVQAAKDRAFWVVG